MSSVLQDYIALKRRKEATDQFVAERLSVAREAKEVRLAHSSSHAHLLGGITIRSLTESQVNGGLETSTSRLKT